MNKKREGPELQMQDVLLACGELNERERVAVQWTLDRHNEIVLSMCSKEWPSDEELERLAKQCFVDASNEMVSKKFPGMTHLLTNKWEPADLNGVIKLNALKKAILLGRDHFPRSPKVGALLEAGNELSRQAKGTHYYTERHRNCDLCNAIKAWDNTVLKIYFPPKADASLQGEGSSSSLGDPLPPVGSASLDGRFAPSAEPTPETGHLGPPIAADAQAIPEDAVVQECITLTDKIGDLSVKKFLLLMNSVRLEPHIPLHELLKPLPMKITTLNALTEP